MIDKNVSQLVQTSTSQWTPSKVPGVSYIALHTDKEEREGTFLLRMNPNTAYPRHRHPHGEEILVLKGEMTVGIHKLKAGDYLYSPKNTVHDASTVAGCMFLTVVPKAVQFIASSSTEEWGEEISTETTGAPAASYSPTHNDITFPDDPSEEPKT